jgi:rod shape-determining protein MreD
MRNLTFYCVGLLMILIQTNLYRLLGPLSSLTFGESLGARHWLHGATPNLVLPLIIFLGVHEHSMARGALLAFGFGYTLDILSAAPMFLFTFVCVAIWWLSRVAGVRLTAQTFMTRVPLAFGFAVVESAIILTLLAIFGTDNFRPLELATIVAPRATATALVAPLIFSFAQKVHLSTLPSRTAGEATTG